MKAVVMAGGLGTRLRPALAAPINKHLVPVGNKPLILHPLQLLARSGIREVLMLLNGPHAELILETVGTGEEFGLNIYYRYSPESYGASVGRHLELARPFVNGEHFLLILGDSLYFLDVIPHLQTVSANHCWAMPVDETWDDPEKYALVPHNARLVQTGLWLFDERVFRILRTWDTGQVVRIRDLVAALPRHELTVSVLPSRSFLDCGTPEAVRKADGLLLCRRL